MKNVTFLFLLATLPLITVASASEYYCDVSKTADGSGTTTDPWQWSQAIDAGNVAAGDTVYVRGEATDATLTITSTNAIGSSSNWITYKAWPEQTQPKVKRVLWQDTSPFNAYHVFDGWYIDYGYTTDVSMTNSFVQQAFAAIVLDKVSYVTIQNSTLDGVRFGGLSDSPFTPHPGLGATVHIEGFLPNSYVTHITIDSCTLRYGWTTIACPGDKGTTNNITITNNDFYNSSNDNLKVSMTATNDQDMAVVIRGNTTQDQHQYHGYYYHPVIPNSDWDNKIGESCTMYDGEDAIGSFVFWAVDLQDRVWLFHDDPSSLRTDVAAGWSDYTLKLDSDPSIILDFDTGTNRDYSHIDHFAFEGGNNVLVENNTHKYSAYPAQCYKLGPINGAYLKNLTIRNNLLYSVDATASGPMLFFCGSSPGVENFTFVHNICDSKSTGTIRIYPTAFNTNCVIANNIISGTFAWGANPDVLSNNIWGDSQTHYDTSDIQGVDFDSIFVNRGVDYTPINENAPQVNAGETVYVPSTDKNGVARDDASPDIGCYEYTGISLVSDDVSVAVGESSTITVQINNPENQTLTYEVTGLPTGATYTVVDGSLLISWPDDVERGTYTPTVTATNGSDSTSTSFTVTVGSDDYTDPSVSGMTPSANAIQAPLNTMISCHVTDAGDGVNASTVVIKVDGTTVYTGNVSSYTSSLGVCRRSGTTADYAYAFQYSDNLSYDQEVTVTVNASDQAGNAMTTVTSSFTTEMRLFGDNTAAVDTGSYDQAHMSTVTDSSGNKWMAWHMGDSGERDVYVGLVDGSSGEITSPVRVTSDQSDQCYPQIAIDSSNRLYLTWQSNSRGVWDVLFGTSLDGINWTITRAVDSDYDQTQPVMACNTDATVYIAFEDNRNGNQDIYLASSSNLFVSNTVTAITSNSTSQTSPALAIDTSLVVYVAWQDERNGNSDIYGATSAGSWANQALITGTGDQTDPALAVDSLTSTAHLLWVDDSAGDLEVYYTSSTGFSDGPLTATSFIDDSTGADQSEPTLITYSTDSRTNIFACWTDSRSIAGSTDTDLYFADLGSGTAHTNVLVGDDSTNSNQSQPFLGLDDEGSPYLVWADDRDSVDTLYYVGNTYINPTPFKSELITASTGGTVGVAPASIDDTSDVSVQLPANACDTDVTITISEIENPPALDMPTIAAYDFGPSNIDFDEPVTITIPYEVSDATASAYPYWYNSLTDGLSQQGITDIERIVISDTIHALTFKTTHFTPYYLVNSTSSVSASASSGGGGCSVMPGTSPMNPVEFFLPFGIVVLVISVLRYRDRRRIIA